MDRTNLLESIGAGRARTTDTTRLASKKILAEAAAKKQARVLAEQIVQQRFEGRPSTDRTALVNQLTKQMSTAGTVLVKEDAEQLLEEMFMTVVEQHEQEISTAAETMQLPDRLIQDILLFEGVSSSDDLLSCLTNLCPVDLDDRLNILIKESTDTCSRVALFNPETGEYRVEHVEAQIGPIQDHPSVSMLLRRGWLIVSINGPTGPTPVQVAVTNRQRARRVGD